MNFTCFECDAPIAAGEEHVCAVCSLVYCPDCMAEPPQDDVCALCAADAEERE